jgi:mRNA-degrading endonuclease RelE of RelBE toxin-antitoxin system
VVAFTSKRTKRFRALLEALPADAQRQAGAAYRLFVQNPRHPSLQFKRISPADPTLYSARVGDHYRVIGKLKGDTIIWDWIGTHEDYNRIVRGH